MNSTYYVVDNHGKVWSGPYTTYQEADCWTWYDGEESNSSVVEVVA